MKKLFLYFSILSIILSCNREAFYNDGEIGEGPNSIITTMVTPEFEAVDHFVSKEDIGGFLSQSFLKKEPVEIIPIDELGVGWSK